MIWKTLLAVAVILIGLVAAFCIVVALQPAEFSVERSATIAAPPDRVFAQVNDFKAWDSWSPWSKLDPNAKTKISEPSAGKGATFGWNGNSEVGEGTLTILESKPDELVEVEQEFVRPFAGKARMAFTLAPQDGQTKVQWKMTGQNGFMGKAMCLFMDMDTILGPNFEQGLASIKQTAEKGDAAPVTTP